MNYKKYLNLKFLFALTILATAFFYMFIPRNALIEKRLAHADESEQASTYLKLKLENEYNYNPHGPHGPILYYYTNLFSDIFDIEDTIENLRKALFPILIFSCLALLLISIKSSFLTGSLAVLFYGLSVISIIYTSYFVHESFFALFTFLFLHTLYFCVQKPSWKNFVLLGFFIGLMQSTKETSVIVFCATLFPFVLLEVKSKFSVSKNSKYIFATAISALLVYVAFYSSFGKNWNGVIDGFLSYTHFAEKSSSVAHTKEFFYYFKLFLPFKHGGIYFGEFALFIATIIGIAFSFINKNSYFRFLSIFCMFYITLLSLIDYKTPWLLLSLVLPMCAVSGYGLASLFEKKNFWSKILFFVLLFGTIYWQSKQIFLIKRYANDPRNPYIYVHTVGDYKNFLLRMEKAHQIKGDDLKTSFYMRHSPWPSPWYLRQIKGTTYHNRPNKKIKDSHIIITDNTMQDNLNFDKSLYQEEFYGLRENLILTVYIKKNLFEEIIK